MDRQALIAVKHTLDDYLAAEAMVFRSTRDAERHGFDRRHIWAVASGRRCSHRGWCWWYLRPRG